MAVTLKLTINTCGLYLDPYEQKYCGIFGLLHGLFVFGKYELHIVPDSLGYGGGTCAKFSAIFAIVNRETTIQASTFPVGSHTTVN